MHASSDPALIRGELIQAGVLKPALSALPRARSKADVTLDEPAFRAVARELITAFGREFATTLALEPATDRRVADSLEAALSR